MAIQDSYATIVETRWERNTATSGNGGALYYSDGFSDLVNVHFIENTAVVGIIGT